MENIIENTKKTSSSKKSKKTTIIALTIAVVSVLIILFLINATQAMLLKYYLKNGRWEDSRGGHLCILDISNETINYRVSSAERNAPLSEQRAAAVTVATYQYKAISMSKIKILHENGKWETITVKFPFAAAMSDYSYMILHPAFTIDREEEEWLDF